MILIPSTAPAKSTAQIAPYENHNYCLKPPVEVPILVLYYILYILYRSTIHCNIMFPALQQIKQTGKN